MTIYLLDLLPRLVTPEGVVILPEEIEALNELSLECPYFVSKKGTYQLYDCRCDRQAPFPDKNGKRVFERDTVNDVENFGVSDSTVSLIDGAWVVVRDDGWYEEMLCDCRSRIEVTGMIPFGEETN